MKKLTFYRQIIQTLERLHKSHPTYNMGRHISTALDGSDLWGVTDKDLLESLKKYEIELDMDTNHVDDEIDNIIKEGMDLRGIFDIDDVEVDDY